MKKIKCILLVDDDHIHNYIVFHLVTKLEICETFIHIVSGKEALDFIHQNAVHHRPQPEVILIAMNMPGMPGIEFIDALKKSGCNFSAFKIIAITNSIQPADFEKLKNLGVYEVLTKPLTSEKLVRHLPL